MIGPTEAPIPEATELTPALRAWLHAHRSHSDGVLADTLAYELVRLIARNASTEAIALGMIELWIDSMRVQIRAFGVETEHP